VTDEELPRLLRLGRLALETNRFEDSARRYADALEAARARDDAPAIAEAAAGRVAALLADGKGPEARRTASDALADLARRGATAPPKLLLADASARLRTGDLSGAEAVARDVAARRLEDPDAARRAAFVAGLAAAWQGDAVGLAAWRGVLPPPPARDTGFRADIAELDAQAALLARDFAGARTLAEAAVPLRRDALDLRGVGRLLLLSADAAGRAGDARGEADLLFRAAQAAAGREDWDEAARLFPRAEAAARRAGNAALARRAAGGSARAQEEREAQGPQDTGSSARRRTGAASGS